MHPRRLKTTVIATYPFLRLLEHEVVERDKQRTVVSLDLRDWALVGARDTEGCIVLVEQFRHGVAAWSVEVAGGLIEPGEEPLQAAERELFEETGYGGGELRHLGTVRPNPALSSNLAHLYFAEAVEYKAAPACPDDEFTRVRRFAPAALAAAVKDGTIQHGLTLLLLALEAGPGLFATGHEQGAAIRSSCE